MAVKVKWNDNAIRDMLKSDDMQAHLKQVADRIANAAGEGFEAEVDVGRNRARAAIVSTTAEAMMAEATDHALMRAIDAGR